MHGKTLWADLPFFLAIARTGTLSAAARNMKVDRTTIGRRISKLEEMLEKPLFNRTDSGFELTAYGKKIYAAVENAEQELGILAAGGNAGDGQRIERVRVSLSEHLFITLSGCFRKFMNDHPDIFLEVTTTDRIVDLSQFEADVAIRISKRETGELKARNFGKPVLSLYRRKGSELAPCRFIARSGLKRVPGYVLKEVPEAILYANVDGVVALRELIRQGVGIGILPRYFGDRDRKLERYPATMPNPGFVLSVICRPELRRVRRIKTFMDYMGNALKELKGLE